MTSVPYVELHGPVRRLAAPKLRASLERYARRKVSASDVDDIVQSTLTDALAAHLPESEHEARRVIFRIARNKIADHYRRAQRELPEEASTEPIAEGPQLDEGGLLRWVERELPKQPDAHHTLNWMLREVDGEKFEQIASRENIPAPRVRKRVARLRKYLRARWTAQLAAASILVAGLIAGALIWRNRASDVPRIGKESFSALQDKFGSSTRAKRPLPPPGAIWRSDVKGAIGSGLDHFLTYAALEPTLHNARDGQKVSGFRVTSLNLPTWWHRVDIQAGDVIVSVNGRALQDRAQLSEVLASLPRADGLKLDYWRGTTLKHLEYRIVDGPPAH